MDKDFNFTLSQKEYGTQYKIPPLIRRADLDRSLSHFRCFHSWLASTSKKIGASKNSRTRKQTENLAPVRRFPAQKPTFFPLPQDAASAALHQANLAKLFEAFFELHRRATVKAEEATFTELTPAEFGALQLYKRGQRSKSTSGASTLGGKPVGPTKQWHALLGGVVAVLGRYAASMAMQWLNPELKVIVTSFDGTTDWSTTPVTQLLNGVAQGLDYNNRIGNSIRLVAVDVDLTIRTTVAAAGPTFVQAVLLVDTQTEGAVPPSADVFQSGVTLLALAAVPNPVTAPDRFAIVHAEKFHLVIGDGVTTAIRVFGGPSVHHIKFRKSLVEQNCHTYYQSTTGAITSISRGSMYLIGVSSEATNTPIVYGHVRVWFEDN